MTNILRRLMALISLLVVTLLSLTGMAQANCAAWNVVASPNPGTNPSLNAVAAVSPTNTWAVGGWAYFDSGKNALVARTITEHWNGSSWSVVPSPNPGATNSLSGVAAVSATNMWAVGRYSLSHAPSQTLILHWNGSSWNVVSNPNPTGSSASELLSVTAISASNIWAVGDYRNSNGISQTLIKHFNGSSWSIVASPNPGSASNSLQGVTRVPGTSQLWAVGSFSNSSGSNQTLTERFNGSSWSIVASPNAGPFSNSLSAVAAVSTSTIWAVGSYSTANGLQTLTERFNGSRWSIVASPNPQSTNNVLRSVVAISATSIVAVGEAGVPMGDDSMSSPTSSTLIERFNGSSWSIVASPNPGVDNSLNGVTQVPSTGQLWAVGSYDNGAQPSYTLTEFYC